jgi:hypothetical protein
LQPASRAASRPASGYAEVVLSFMGYLRNEQEESVYAQDI